MHIPKLDLTNTPGVYYALTYGLSAILYVRLNRRREEKRRRVLRFVLLWAFLFIFMAVTYRIDVRFFLLCVALEFSVVCLMIRSSCDMDRNKCVYFAARAFILGEFAASLEWQLFYYALTVMHVPLQIGINILFLAVCHCIVFPVVWALEKRFCDGNESLIITRREMAVALILLAMTYALSNVSYAIQGSPFSSALTQEIFAMRTLADLGGLAILFGYHMVLHDTQARNDVEQLQRVLDQQYEQYRISEETVDLINRKYHDLKHQIAYLKSDITEEAKRAYLDEMEEEVRIYEAQNRTGNHVVDTILTEKSLLCRKEKISLTAVADGAAMDFLTVPEICSLLGNALDNAIEAASQVTEEQERLIRLLVDRQRGFLRIHVENRFRGTLRIRDGLPETTKADKTQHGFGVRSMRKIAEQRDGTMRTEAADGWFRLSVLIPIPSGEV